MTTHQGEIFGGYLDATYDSSIYEFQADPKAFLFSLTKNEKYKIQPDNSDNAMFYDQESNMLAFGRDDLAVSSGCVGTTLLFGGNYELPESLDYSFGWEPMTYLTNEEAYVFQVTEMETFQVFLF